MSAEQIQIVSPGRDSSEFKMYRWGMAIGAVVVLGCLAILAFGNVNSYDQGWGDFLGLIKWGMGIGAALALSSAGLYGGQRTGLKKSALGAMIPVLFLALALVAGPAFAGALDQQPLAPTSWGDQVEGAKPQPVTTAPQPVTAKPAAKPAPQAAPAKQQAGWGDQVLEALGFKQKGQPMTKKQAQATLAIMRKLSQQNLQLKTDLDAAQARQQVYSLSGGSNQVDLLAAQFAARVNQAAVYNGIARTAYGGGAGQPYAAAGQRAAGAPLTKEQIEKAVSEAIEKAKPPFEKLSFGEKVIYAIGAGFAASKIFGLNPLGF